MPYPKPLPFPSLFLRCATQSTRIPAKMAINAASEPAMTGTELNEWCMTMVPVETSGSAGAVGSNVDVEVDREAERAEWEEGEVVWVVVEGGKGRECDD